MNYNHSLDLYHMLHSKKICKNLIFILLVGISGCAGPTHYRPSEDGTGYSDSQIGGDRYWVSYTANSITSYRKLEQYNLYRSAQITLESGQESFVVMDKNSAPADFPDYVDAGSRFYRHHDFEHHHLWFGDRVFSDEFSALNSKSLTRNAAAIMITVFSGIDPPVEGKVYQAREVIELFGPSVVRP